VKIALLERGQESCLTCVEVNGNIVTTIIVPDRRSRIIPEVVLVRRWAVRVLGIWRGEGLG
jgi:hypothetical protein